MIRIPSPSVTERSIVLVGATGFIGSQVRHQLMSFPRCHLTVLTRLDAAPQSTSPSGVTQLRADLSDVASLAHAVEGAHCVINAASYVGSDPASSTAVNHHGARNLITACHTAGVPNFLQLSTTAIYGSGPHRGETADDLPIAPESTTSKTRAAGDRAVIDGGGCSIRPALVIGAGDRWVAPGVARMIRSLNGTINDGSAQLSVIDVSDLGAAVARIAMRATVPQGPLHATYTNPKSLRELLPLFGADLPAIAARRSHSTHEASARLGAVGFSSHQVKMVAEDHWYASEMFWQATGREELGRPETSLSVSP